MRMRTKPALPCSHTSLKTHQSTGIRRAEIQNREKEAEANRRRRRRGEEPNRKCRRPQVRSSPRYLARPNPPPTDDDDADDAWGKQCSVSRREMSLPVSVVGAIDIAIGAVGAIDIALLPSRNCPPLPLLHHLPPLPSRPSFLLSPFLLPLLPLKSYSHTLTHPYFSTHCVPCNSSSPPLIGCFVPLICQARRAQNTSQHSSPITYSIHYKKSPYRCIYIAPNLCQDLVVQPQMQSRVRVRSRRWRQRPVPAPGLSATRRRAPSSSTPTTTASPRASTSCTRDSCGLSP